MLNASASSRKRSQSPKNLYNELIFGEKRVLVSGSDRKSVGRKKQKLIIGSDGETGLILEERQT